MGRRRPTPPPPPPPGRGGRRGRRAALEERRREHRRRSTAAGAGAIAIAVLAAAGVATFVGNRVIQSRGEPEPTITSAPGDPVSTTLVFGTEEQSGEVLWATLLAHNDETGAGAVVYVPAHTAVEIPGRGLHALSEAYLSGRVPLLLLSVENLLGLNLDRYLELSDQDARLLFEATGPISVEVPEEVRIGTGGKTSRVIFGAGQQRLPPSLVAQLLYTVGQESDDIGLGTRHIAFWQGLVDAFAERPDDLAAAVRKAGAALSESDATPDELASTFADLARLPAEQLTVDLLPVEQVSVGNDELYSSRSSEVEGFLAGAVGAEPALRDEVRVQVLNGNGVPGIGQRVARRLVGKGFRVIVSANARRFDYAKTLIITYEGSEEADAIARRARALLGVGAIRLSAQSQGIVDLTIVVGKDFLRAR